MKYHIYHCVSKNTAKDIQNVYKIPPKKIKIIYNWVDTEFRNQKQTQKKNIMKRKKRIWWEWKTTFLYFWHAGKSKWIEYLINALPKITKIKNIKIIFNLIDSKRTNKTIKQIKNIQKKYPEKIKLLNGLEKKDLRDLIASIDCVIAPSISEWFGSVHTESCAMNKILITTNTSAIPEVVRWKIKFIQPWNNQEIIKAIQSVKNWKRQTIKKKEFNWDKTVELIENLYN